jgi:hypothetical protein
MKKSQDNSQNAASAKKARTQFSPDQPAGSGVKTCPHAKKPVPDKPCNLAMIRLQSEEEGKAPRTMEIREGQSLRRGSSPTLLPPRGVFQIIANSEANGVLKVVELEVETEAVCSHATHPAIQWSDHKPDQHKIAKKQKLSFYRHPMLGDHSGLGFFAILNGLFDMGSEKYPVQAVTCGMPQLPKNSVENLNAVIEVFPGDQFTLEFAFPPLCSPSALSFDTASNNWTSKREKDNEELKKTGEKADRIYKAYAEVHPDLATSNKDFQKFQIDQKKRELGYLEGDKEKVNVSLTQKDGDNTLKAPISDIVKLLKMIRNAEYAIKEIQIWIDKMQVGPGVRFKIECQFLICSIKAKWGYAEYLDDRVFLSYSGSAEIDIIKVEMEITAGVKFAGFSDLFFGLSGSGTIGLTIDAFKKDDPDRFPGGHIKPRGKVEIAGRIEGALGWVAKAVGKIELVFNADTKDLEILTAKAILKGKIVISREEICASVTASNCLWSTTKKCKLVDEDRNYKVFEF